MGDLMVFNLTIAAEASIVSVTRSTSGYIPTVIIVLRAMITIADKAGLAVPRFHNLVKFQITGPGKIVAVGNGDATSHQPFQAAQCSAYNGRCLVIIRGQAGQLGKIVLKAESKGLSGAEIVVRSR